MRIDGLETPGHTPESICLVITDLVVTDEEKSQRPWAVLTGDTLFIGDVGRPDLSKTHTPQELAGLMYDSLHGKLLTLPDDVLVYPAHGAGSLCGRNMRAETLLHYRHRTTHQLCAADQASRRFCAVDPRFGNAVYGIATIHRWPNRVGSVLSFQVNCRPSAVATHTMSVDYNAGSVVPAPSTVEIVTFKCLQYVRFSLITNANTGVFIVLAGASNSITIGSAQYTYTVSGSVGTLNKVSSGTLTQVGQWTFGVQPTDVIVWLTVTFGDTLMVTTVYEQANTSPAAGSASQPQNYFERVAPDTVNSYQSQINYSAGSQMYLPALSSDTATQLNQLGVYQVPGEPGIYVDYVFHPEAYFFNEVVIQGRRASTYSGNPAQTTVAISLADGTYQNLAGQTVTVGSGTYTDAFGNTQTVASGNILASSLPLSFGNITYVAVAVPSQTSPGSLASELITIGSTQYPDFTTANKKILASNSSIVEQSTVSN